jgi:hypothetical protein
LLSELGPTPADKAEARHALIRQLAQGPVPDQPDWASVVTSALSKLDPAPDGQRQARDIVLGQLCRATDSCQAHWLASALARELRDGSPRVVPVRLADAVLPALLEPIAWIDAQGEEPVGVARKVMGLGSSAEYIEAVQAEIDEAGLEFGYFHGYGVVVGCPKCGAAVIEREPWAATDCARDATSTQAFIANGALARRRGDLVVSPWRAEPMLECLARAAEVVGVADISKSQH